MTWYEKGLYFKCLKDCSKCCSSSPGYVWLKNKEIEKIAKFLKLSKDKFLKKYTRYVRGKISLKEFLNFDCCFLKDKKCQIYAIRPVQCRTFPFWKCNLQSSKIWESLKKDCPGIDHENGKLFTFEEIQKILRDDLF